MKILHVVGARPNFIKVAPVMLALSEFSEITQLLVHTGQHYDVNMSDVFFQQLGLPAPDVNLGVGSGSHAQQTAKIMQRFEPVLLQHEPHLVLVYGDVNSTVAAAVVCAKLLVPVGHVEAGLRSFDRSMPEEINRVLTDQISDLLFTPSSDADQNLLREGIAPNKTYQVGNVMIDTLIRLLPLAENRSILDDLGLARDDGFVLVTLHRPSTVDDSTVLADVLATLTDLSSQLPVIFPVHPRTRERLKERLVLATGVRLHLIDPVSYLDFLSLQKRAAVVITDSGGVQEETTFLGIPCLTVRKNTERPITVELGTNILVGHDTDCLKKEAIQVLNGNGKKGRVPPLWDGKAANRIAGVIHDIFVSRFSDMPYAKLPLESC